MQVEEAAKELPTAAEEVLTEPSDSDWVIRRPKRAKVTAEESIRRTEDFINNPKRREQFIKRAVKPLPLGMEI